MLDVWLNYYLWRFMLLIKRSKLEYEVYKIRLFFGSGENSESVMRFFEGSYFCFSETEDSYYFRTIAGVFVVFTFHLFDLLPRKWGITKVES